MREACVAGSFYPRSEKQLRELLKEFEKRISLNDSIFEKVPLACVVPHAGYVYSGATAMHCYKYLAKVFASKPPVFVILSPNHTGLGSVVSMSFQDWRTPLGVAKCNKIFGEEILNSSDLIEANEEAHFFEHSIEVQLPFLQYFFKEFSFVGITLMQQDSIVSKKVSEALIKAEKNLGVTPFVIASSDFTHYEEESEARRKDEKVIKEILCLDVNSFYKTLSQTNASLCGYGAIASAMFFSKNKGAREGVLLDFSNSGVASKSSKVVDYASIAFV